jgi:hypothetical protein
MMSYPDRGWDRRPTLPKPMSRSGIHPFVHFRDASRVQALAFVLIAVSLADLIMTYLLLQASPRFYESNPVADWFFRRWNMAGMTAYKFVIVGVIVILCEVIERARPGWGQWVLALGCVATALAFARGLSFYLGAF